MKGNAALGATLVMALLALCFSPGAWSAPDQFISKAYEPERPKIGLVLSGGGARGAAHIGVLRVLEELNIPVDFIAGTSMGAIIGGLYAAGLSPDEIEAAMRDIDWDRVFIDAPPRQERSFRRKRDDDLYLVKKKLGFNSGRVELPLGFIQGQKFNLILQKLSLRAAGVKNFDHLPTPFRAVATDIGSGSEIVIGTGSLAVAMRASMAVPGIFAPTQLDGRLLVDGGIVNNLPIDVARSMGADLVIAVDIATPLTAPGEINNVLSITDQLIKMMTTSNVSRQLETLHSKDILIRPDLADITSADFKSADQAIESGEMAARNMIQALLDLSLDPASYARYRERRENQEGNLPLVDYVRIENNSRLADSLLNSRLNIPLGELFQHDALEQDLNSIYGLDVFETVSYRLELSDDKQGVVIEAKEKPWGPNYLQFGAALTGNADGENSYNFGFSYLKTQMNELGGEWRTAIQVGESPVFFSEFYQPLSFDTRYFISPRILYQKRNVNLFQDSNKLAEYRVENTGLELALGRELGNWGEARLGIRRFTGDAEVLIGDPGLADVDFDTGEIYLRLSLDKFDNVNFPRSGAYAVLENSFSRKGIGADASLDQLSLDVLGAYSKGEHTLLLGARAESTTSGDAPVQERFTLGGFLQLSGLSTEEISGEHSALLRMVYYRRFYPVSILPAYVGFSLEGGNVWESRSDIELDSFIPAGSLFMGLDTIVGPLYLGYGLAEGGRDSLFLFLGRNF